MIISSEAVVFFAKEGFFEREAAAKLRTPFSPYESRHAPEHAKPFQRGINSIQLMDDGKLVGGDDLLSG